MCNNNKTLYFLHFLFHSHISAYIWYSQVAYNKADLGVTSFGCSRGRNTIVDCSHSRYHGPYSWVTRAPKQLPPATALMRIYDLDCWILIFVSIASITIFLLISAAVGTYYGIIKQEYVDLTLVPFRQGNTTFIFYKDIFIFFLKNY